MLLDSIPVSLVLIKMDDRRSKLKKISNNITKTMVIGIEIFGWFMIACGGDV